MAVAHFTTIPCEPNTAYKAQRKSIFYNIFPQKGLTGVKYSPFVFLHDVYCYCKDIVDTDGVYVADMLMV